MGEGRSDGSDGGRRQITRRAAIGTGIAAVGIGAGLMPAASASASASAASPRRQLAALKAAIRGSRSSRAAKTRLLAILGDVGDELAHGHNLDCRQILRQQFIPVVKHPRGQISARDAKAWAADAERLARALPHRDAGLSAGAGGRVTVLNCFNEPIHGLVVSGAAVGDIEPISTGGAGKPTAGTPAGITVPRSKGPTPGAFAIGDNTVVAHWDSFNATAAIRIPDPKSEPISLDDPLALYVATNQALLMTLRGFVLNAFNVTLSA